MEDKLYEDVNEGVLRHVGSGHTILDVGCGSGTLGLEMKRRGNIVWGLDKSKNAFDLAKSKLDRAFLCDVTDFKKLPLRDDKFDVIVFADILEHLGEPGGVLKGYSTYLKEGGFVVVSIPNISSWTIRIKRLFGPLKPDEYGILDGTHKHFYDLAKAKKLVNDAGYKIKKVDVNPNILRAFFTSFRSLWCSIVKDVDVVGINERIVRSAPYRVYVRVILPLELIPARLLKNLLAFQFVIKAQKSG